MKDNSSLILTSKNKNEEQNAAANRPINFTRIHNGRF